MVAALAACTPFLIATEARAADDPAAWAPGDAAFYLGITNGDAFVKAVKKTSNYQLLHDPILKDSVAPWTEFATKLEKMAADKLGLDNPKQLELYPHGAVALFGILRLPNGEGDEGDAHAGCVMDMGEDLDAAKRLAHTVVEKALAHEGRRSTKEIAGTEITTIRFAQKEPSDDADVEAAASPEETGGDDEIAELIESLPIEEAAKAAIADMLRTMEPPDEFAFAFVDSKLVLTSDTETAAQAVRRLKKGKEGTFAGSSAMKTLRRHCDADAQVQVVVNLPLIIDLASKEDPEAAKVNRGLGLDALGPAVTTFNLAPEHGVNARVTGFLEIKGEVTGIAKLLKMKNTKTAPAATIGADAVLYGSINLNPSEILAEVLEITGRIDPQAGEQMRAGMKVPQQDGSELDVQKDVVDHLTGPLFGMMTAAKPYDADHVNAMIALGHRSRAGVAKLLALLPPGMLIPRDMMGSTIYESPMLPVLGLGAALTERVLVVLGTKGLVESYIRAEGREGGGLADDPDYKKIARMMPKQSCAVMYANDRAYFEAQAAIDKAGDAATEPPMYSPAGAFLRYFLLQNYVGEGTPEAAGLAKYFGPSMVTLTTEPEGLRLDVLQIRSLE